MASSTKDASRKKKNATLKGVMNLISSWVIDATCPTASATIAQCDASIPHPTMLATTDIKEVAYNKGVRQSNSFGRHWSANVLSHNISIVL